MIWLLRVHGGPCTDPKAHPPVPIELFSSAACVEGTRLGVYYTPHQTLIMEYVTCVSIYLSGKHGLWYMNGYKIEHQYIQYVSKT